MLPLKHSITLLLLLISSLVKAAEVEVKCEKVEHRGGDLFTFYISVDHNDENWEHYVDRFELLNEKGKIFAVRVLRHPHVNQRPFTRSVTTMLKEPLNKFSARGHDLVHGYGPATQCNLEELLDNVQN